jgi:predicted nuclease of predicted toxin-antitoxin system
MKFFVYANLPPGLASWLRGFGHDAIHVMDVVGLGQDDRAIFDHGRLHDLIIVTKDEDFAMLMTLSSDPPKVVWLRLGNATNPALRAWLDPMLPEICSVWLRAKRLSRLCDLLKSLQVPTFATLRHAKGVRISSRSSHRTALVCSGTRSNGKEVKLVDQQFYRVIGIPSAHGSFKGVEVEAAPATRGRGTAMCTA